MIGLPSKPLLATIDEAVKVTAVLVGGAWTYLNYARGRTFRTRLEVDLSGSIGHEGEFFLGECLAKNVGLSKIPLQSKGTGVSVFAVRLATRADGSHRAWEEEVMVLPLYMKHGWIEPGETIGEPVLVAVPKSEMPLLGVRIAVMISNGTTTWNASKIVEYVKAKDGKQTKDKEDDSDADAAAGSAG